MAILLAALRRLKPSSVIAVDGEGNETHVAIVGQRSRYERAARSILALGAYTARCMDETGAITEVLTVRPADELEGAPEVDGAASSAPSSPGSSKRTDEVAVLVKLALDASDRATTRVIEAHRGTTEALSSIVETALGVLKITAERAERLEAMMVKLAARRERELGQAAAELARLPQSSGPEGDDDDDGDKKAEALLEKLVGMAIGGAGSKN